MPKKKFDETAYDPIAADLMREVGASGRIGIVPLAVKDNKVETPSTVGSHALKLQTESTKKSSLASKVTESTITKRFVVTRSEDDDLTEFLLRLQKRAGAKITLSVFARALLNVAMHAEEQLLDEIGNKWEMDLPSTHDSIALADYEDRWMKVIANALRKMPRHSRW